MKPEKYTMRFHATRIRAMLMKKNPCGVCPVWKFLENSPLEDCNQPTLLPISSWSIYTFDPACKICMEFSGLQNKYGTHCPCVVLGKDESVKRGWLKLEEMGML